MITLRIEDLPQEWQEKRTPCEIWGRIMGYYKPYKNYNAGKQSEFNERRYFDKKEID